MKIIVIGGTGLIGTKVVSNLRLKGNEVVAASPSSGVNTITGEGLEAILRGADVVVDVANSPSFEDQAVLDFFTASTSNLLAGEAAAAVKHHIALSVVGTERLLASGYFRGKLAQENLIKASQVPYTILRATQFFEFMGEIVHAGTENGMVSISSALFQPIVSDDVAKAVADVTLDAPLNGTIEVAGPSQYPIGILLENWMRANGDDRAVVSKADALYFGTVLDDQSLIPSTEARIMPTRFEDWIAKSAQPKAVA